MNVFVTRPIPSVGLDLLQEAGARVTVRPDESPIPRDALLAGVRGHDGLISMLTDRVDAEVLDAGPLRVVSNLAAGVDNVDLAAARQRGVPVTNTPDVLTDATADLTLALLLAGARRLLEGDRMVREGRWNGWGPLLLRGADLAGATLGLVGAGRIGAAVATRARAFGMQVVIHDPVPHPEVGPTLPIDELLAVSDFVSLHCPRTDDTFHLLDERRLRLMKPGAWLINTARGVVVDEAALVRVLADGHLGGAALDVFEREPQVHPDLLSLPNVLLAPHVGSATVRTRDTMARIAAENLIAVLSGRQPRYRVA